LLGLRGIVIKSHGSADETAFRHAIGVALAEARKDVPNLITARIESLLAHKEAV
jgi:glycerol-3-phosphate acyltransferase PlsX